MRRDEREEEGDAMESKESVFEYVVGFI